MNFTLRMKTKKATNNIINDHSWTLMVIRVNKYQDWWGLLAGVGDAVADEVVVALAHGAVIDLDEVLVDGLVVVTLDEIGLTH